MSSAANHTVGPSGHNWPGVGRAGRPIWFRALVAVGLLCGTSWASAQASGSSPAQPDVLPTPDSITFARLFDAERNLWASVDLVRSSFEGANSHSDGGAVTILERLRIAPAVADPADPQAPLVPRFRLSFVDSVSSALTPTDRALRRAVYEKSAAFLFLHGTLLVDDPVRAATNYSLHYMGPVQLLGRAAHRVVVLPNSCDRSAFVWDLDVQTGFPLHQAEYTPEGVMMSSLTAVRFEAGNAIEKLGSPVEGWSEPKSLVQHFGSISALKKQLPDVQLVVPASEPAQSGYSLSLIRAIHDDLDGHVDVVLGYGDGLDEILMVQSHGLPPTGLADVLGQGVQTVQRFQDLHTIQLRFQSTDVSFLVVGRASVGQAVLDWTLGVVRSL